MSGDLERRYRRVLRLLPGYYREQWEDDMIAAFLESSLTGEPEEDEFITEFGRPGWPEVTSVAGLAVRLYLGGAGGPRRYFAWGQAIRTAVLAVTLVNAVRGLDGLVLTAWSRRLLGWLPAPPASISPGWQGPFPPELWYVVDYAWIVIFVVLVLRHYRIAQVLAALAIVPDLARLLYGQFTGTIPTPTIGPWAFWVLLYIVPVLAMTAFHGTPRRLRAGPGCWHCPRTISWSPCRCWRSGRPATPPGCRTFPGCTASWSPSPAWRTRPGPAPARPPARACGR